MNRKNFLINGAALCGGATAAGTWIAPSSAQSNLMHDTLPQKPVLFATPEMLAVARQRIAEKPEPANATARQTLYQTAWQHTRTHADHALTETPTPYQEEDHIKYFNTGIAQAGLTRDAALVFALTGESKYADGALKYLLAWAKDAGKNPNPGSHHPLGQGLVISRVMAIFCYAYTLIYDRVRTDDRQFLEAWMRTLPPIILATRKIWVDNDFFGRQYFNNHLAVQTMGMAILGFTLRDKALIAYAIYGDDNVRNFKREIAGAILLPGDSLEKSDPTLTHGAPAAQAGEVYDRHRIQGGHGLGYCLLHTRALTMITEAAANNGVLLDGGSLYHYKDPRGKNLEMPYNFYANFFVTGDVTIQGGYYTPDKVVPFAEKSLYEIAAFRYPDNAKLRAVINTPGNIVNDAETFGFTTTLTHGTVA